MLETQRFNPPQVLEVKSRELEVSLGENTNAKEIGFNIYRDLEDEVCSCWVDFKPCKIRLALGTYDVRIKGKLLLVNE
jgi:hypothetical protein